MFNTTVIATELPARPTSNHTIVHEHRAPTDESVRLLRELEQAAEARIVKTTRVTDTPIECVVHQMRDYRTDEHRVQAVFSVNAKKLTAEIRVEMGEQAHVAMLKLRDEISRVIANNILSEALRGFRLG